MWKNKRNKGKKGPKDTPDATWHGKGEGEPNGKIGSKETPELTRRSKIEAEFNANIESQKTPEAEHQGQTNGEANLEDESNLPRTKVIHLQGEWDPMELAQQGALLFRTDPYKIHYDIYRFICHFGYVFMWVCAIASVVILITGDKLLTTNYNENLWIIVLSICFMYLIASISAMLALKTLPDLLGYILKYVGVFSSVIVGIFTVVTLTRSNLLLYIDIDEATVELLCIIWWISIISLMVTVYAISNPRQLKVELRCFLNFFTIWGFLFCLFLVMLMILAFYCEKNLFGYEFDEMFFTISVSICLMYVLALASMEYVLYCQRNDKKLFRTVDRIEEVYRQGF